MEDIQKIVENLKTHIDVKIKEEKPPLYVLEIYDKEGLCIFRKTGRKREIRSLLLLLDYIYSELEKGK